LRKRRKSGRRQSGQRFHVTAFTQVGPETKKREMEDIRGRREQRFHGLGFKLEGEDDEGKGSEKNTHAACEREKSEILGTHAPMPSTRQKVGSYTSHRIY
jgi:hypothetical protein